jgi:peptidoglycan-associated lipoprotein
MLLVAGGCAGKRVASTSGDQSMAAKDKSVPDEAVEPMRQDQIASVETPSPKAGSQSQDAPGSGSTSISNGSAPSPDLTGLGDIYFDFDQYYIRKDAQPVLEGNAEWLRNEAGKSFVIEGHCDERGTLAYNLVLGEKRARSVKRYLEDLGIPASRVQTTSYGEVRPFCKEHTEECWQKNRRAHFVVQ